MFDQYHDSQTSTQALLSTRVKESGDWGVDGFEGVDGGGHQESKRHMKEEEGSFLSRDGAGNNGLRNNLRRRWQRGERKAITT